jgi:hypothetical protein
MRHHLLPSLALALAALGGCTDREAPTAAPGGEPLRVIASSNTILTAQLRTLPGFAVLQWGNLRLAVNFAPVDPCREHPTNPVTTDGMTNVAVCGTIFNPGGALYQGGGIYTVPPPVVDALPLLVASFTSIAAPVDPCRLYQLQGYFQVADADALDLVTSPASYQVLFDAATPGGTETRIGGLLDGSAWGPVGTVAVTNPTFAQDVCTIEIAPPS